MLRFDAHATRPVRAMALSGATLYFDQGGSGGASTNKLVVAVDSASGRRRSLRVRAHVNPCREEHHEECVATPSVNALAVNGRTLFVVGFFNVVNGANRLDGAAVDVVTGRSLPWAPRANNAISALAVDGDDVFVGGDFTRIGGRRRSHLAVLDQTYGVARPWNPRATAVTDLAVGPRTVFVAANGDAVYDVPEEGLVAYDRRSARRLRWRPAPNGDVSALALFHGRLFAGGDFNGVRSVKRPSLAAINIKTGALERWSPQLRGTLVASHPQVEALASDGRLLFVGGDFEWIDGQKRNYVAAFDLKTRGLVDWNPDADSDVLAFAVSGSTVFAGGYFQEMGSQPHSRLAKIDAVTGHVSADTPNVDGTVLALTLLNDTLYVGGVFDEIDGTERDEIAAIDLSTLALRAWNPGADSPVWALTASASSIYAGGVFETIGGQRRSSFAALDPLSAAVQDEDLRVQPSGDPVAALERYGSTLYLGGDFNEVGGVRTGGVAAFDLTAHVTTAWLPRPDRSVDAIAVSDDAVLVGGDFDWIGGVSQPYFAIFPRR